MNSRNRLGRAVFLLCGLGILAASTVAPVGAIDSLTWRKDKGTVDADISTWDLVRTLENIADATGWRILIEPGTALKVSTKFKDRSPDKALDLLLGDLGRVLLPPTNSGGSRQLLVFRTSEKNATRVIRPPSKSGKPIPNELIVTMKEGKSLDDLAKKLGAKILIRSSDGKSGRLQFENEEAANAARDSLRDNDDVGSADPNFAVSAQPTPDSSGVPSAGNLKFRPVSEGDATIVALIDTAVQKGDLDKFLLEKLSIAGEGCDPGERPTHGTSMLGTLASGAAAYADCQSGSSLRFLPVDVYGCNATTTTFEVAEGIRRAIQRGASIINLSLGSEGDTPYLHQVIRAGADAGRVFVASAGNTPVTTPTFPAAYPEVIAVTASDGRGNLASYANRGSFVDVVAPGSSVISFNGQSYRVNGTSPAAAYISGAIGAMRDCSGMSLSQAAAAIQRSPARSTVTAPR